MTLKRTVSETLICDLGTNGEHKATGTVSVGLSGTWYEIDACDKHAEEIDRAVEPIIRRGRRRGRPKVRTKRVGTRVDNRDVRTWAALQNLECPARGRIPGEIMAKYMADTGRS